VAASAFNHASTNAGGGGYGLSFVFNLTGTSIWAE
jgi:hypothetical protein